MSKYKLGCKIGNLAVFLADYSDNTRFKFIIYDNEGNATDGVTLTLFDVVFLAQYLDTLTKEALSYSVYKTFEEEQDGTT